MSRVYGDYGRLIVELKRKAIKDKVVKGSNKNSEKRGRKYVKR